MLKKSSIVVVPLSVAITSCAAADTAQRSIAKEDNVRQTTSARSEGVLSGESGRMSIDGDIVEITRGEITVNGISYGSVSAHSQVRYVVEGQKRQLFIDGAERKPQR